MIRLIGNITMIESCMHFYLQDLTRLLKRLLKKNLLSMQIQNENFKFLLISLLFVN